MIAVGDKVKVIDQKPPADGTVVDVSTWGKELESVPQSEDGVCYEVQCDSWANSTRWIDTLFVEKR